MKIALVTDWLTGFAGGEQVLLALHELYPDAPIYTSIWNPQKTPQFAAAKIIPSYLQKIPGVKTKTHYQLLIPLMPLAFESFDFKGYDLIISVGQGPAKGIITHPGQRHIAYCNTPMRFIWNLGGDTRNKGRWDSWLRDRVGHDLRIWDVVSASRPDEFLANSATTAARIAKIYRRPSQIVYPPVRTTQFPFTDQKSEDYFMTVGRLVSYKRTDLIIEACKKNKVPLKILGSGPELNNYKKLARGADWIEFLGRVPDSELIEIYAKSRGFIFASEEDFGIVPVEAMASGKPVIAFGKGGVTETVVEGKTGVFFQEQTVDSLIDAMERFEKYSWNKQEISAHAKQYDTEIFKNTIQNLVEL